MENFEDCMFFSCGFEGLGIFLKEMFEWSLSKSSISTWLRVVFYIVRYLREMQAAR